MFRGAVDNVQKRFEYVLFSGRILLPVKGYLEEDSLNEQLTLLYKVQRQLWRTLNITANMIASKLPRALTIREMVRIRRRFREASARLSKDIQRIEKKLNQAKKLYMEISGLFFREVWLNLKLAVQKRHNGVEYWNNNSCGW